MASVMLVYWGRRGISRLVHNIAEAADRVPDLDWCLSLARQNEQIVQFEEFGAHLHAVDTFSSGTGALTGIYRLGGIADAVAAEVRARNVSDVVNLMPHVWSVAAARGARRGGARYHTILHDATPHPGDWTGVVHKVLTDDADRADRVFTLSEGVTQRMVETGRLPAAKMTTLFHPVRAYRAGAERRRPRQGEPWRLLFFGRVLRYKGLPLLVEAVEMLRAQGVHVALTVMGEGSLGNLAPRLAALGAAVTNHWVSEDDFDEALESHHAMILPYIEASQSGPAAAALGNALPVIVTPVGGLVEQVEHEITGLVASSVDASALAASIGRLVGDPTLYDSLVRNLVKHRKAQSADAFVAALLKEINVGASPRDR